MPGIVRKLVIIAAVDGLILQSDDPRRAAPNLLIRYTTTGSAVLRSDSSRDLMHLSSIEAHGIVGLLNISSTSYLVSILRKQQVAQIRGSPVFVITSIGLIPLSSQAEAVEAIDQSKREIQADLKNPTSNHQTDDDSSEDEENCLSDGQLTDDIKQEPKLLSPPFDTSRRTSQGNEDSVAQDVINKKGQYGRFAERWFSRNGWTNEHRRAQGMSADSLGKRKNSETRGLRNPMHTEPSYNEPSQSPEEADAVPTNRTSIPVTEEGSTTASVASTLLPKFLKTTKILLASHSFFFSYDYDITTRLGGQTNKALNLPLHQVVDSQYFWNQHLASPFIANGNDAYVLPVMQGFVGQRAFAINSTPFKDPATKVSRADEGVHQVVEVQKRPEADSTFLLTLISRRSVMRPGLRYLRRGVDEDGHTANSVETEQILSRASWNPGGRVYSFTQYRGSIPLFFSQSPYAFKPVPVLQHSFATNHAAFKRHVSNLISRYGDVQIALLVDKHGGEAEIGQRYEEHTKQMVDEGGVNGVKPGFEWFDFHAVCRGMRFENVSILMDALGDTLDHFGTTVEVNGQLQRRQIGILRTNCMDCLDRTNVVQSACASKALENQLKAEGTELDLQTDITTQWFNTLWADNGDAISKQYSSTAALKGDYTRTRKRDYRGALNDFGLTLSRYYNNIVNDYFSQAAIDYLLGNVTEQVFEEFEANMMSKDPAISMRTVRANAIETSSKIVIADQSENLIGGWTLLSPLEPNTIRTYPFEEIVLLLTDVRLYVVRFDWSSEKVTSFERIDLTSITGIIRGTYVTSTLAASQTDEDKNVGLIIKYRPGKEDISKVNTRSLSTSVGQHIGTDSDPDPAGITAVANLFDPSDAGLSLSRITGRKAARDHLKLLAFKTLPARSSLASVKETYGSELISEKQMVADICDNIKRAAYGEEDGSDTGLSGGFVEEKEIVSLKEARKSTGYLEQWGHELKKMVWA